MAFFFNLRSFGRNFVENAIFYLITNSLVKTQFSFFFYKIEFCDLRGFGLEENCVVDENLSITGGTLSQIREISFFGSREILVVWLTQRHNRSIADCPSSREILLFDCCCFCLATRPEGETTIRNFSASSWAWTKTLWTTSRTSFRRLSCQNEQQQQQPL